ncbi:MAG: hypothetical protein LBF67_09640, partial [Prevotellaceae bacterium]|nr:hypothetical protein [Prevotellaceae bacterium]
MAKLRFWEDLLKRVGLKLSDKLMIGNVDTRATEYCDVSDLKDLINPTKLPNPAALNFTGGATGSYDGSAAKSVAIPVIPASLKNPYPLTITGAATKSYDGSAPVTIDIPISQPEKSLQPLTFGGAGEGIEYDGSVAREVYIPYPARVGQPTGMELSYPASVSIRNAVLQHISARLLPAFVMQDCAIFLPAGGDAIDLYPDGTFRVKQIGTSRVYVVPTLAASAYKTVDITVRPAYLRRTGSGGLRLTGA